MSKILLVEDDMEISTMLKNFLTTEKFEVITAYDGKSALDRFFSDSFSLVLLDLMIPQISGIEVMEKIRENSTVPIIIISAKDTDSDKTLGLGLGADDYITKPFSVTEVLARIKANIRRTTQYAASATEQQPILQTGSLVMNLNEYSVTKNGCKIELTSKEFEILKLLLQNPKKVYTKEQIYSLVWNDTYYGDENAVNVHISRLRNKIEPSRDSGTMHTVRYAIRQGRHLACIDSHLVGEPTGNQWIAGLCGTHVMRDARDLDCFLAKIQSEVVYRQMVLNTSSIWI